MPDHYSWFDELRSVEQLLIMELEEKYSKPNSARFITPKTKVIIQLVTMLDDIYENFSDCVTIEVARQTAGEEKMTFAELLAKLNMTEEDLENT